MGGFIAPHASSGLSSTLVIDLLVGLLLLLDRLRDLNVLLGDAVGAAACCQYKCGLNWDTEHTYADLAIVLVVSLNWC